MVDLVEEYRQREEAYHNDPGVSRSDIIEFEKSPAHFLYWRKNSKEPSQAMNFGTAYHLAILEPEAFERYVGVLNDSVKAEDKAWNSKKNQEAKNEFFANTPVVITEDEYDIICRMRDVLYSKQYILDYLKSDMGQPEVERYGWLNGIKLRCKIDWRDPGFNVDLKTARSAEIEHFRNVIVNQKYYKQAGIYTDIDCQFETDLNDPKPFGFIAQEKDPPYEVSLHWINHELIAQGIMEYRQIVREIKQCFDHDVYPGYDYWSKELDSSFIVESPHWMR